ncbi:hypothetical protein ACLBWP_03535 [Microbacterium sp. M1A1_1b]
MASDWDTKRQLATITRQVRRVEHRGHVVRLAVTEWNGSLLDPADAVQLAHELIALAEEAINADRAERYA